MYKEDLALNNLKWLICHKTQQDPTKLIIQYDSHLFAHSYMVLSV